jgi:hypothetical protein
MSLPAPKGIASAKRRMSDRATVTPRLKLDALAELSQYNVTCVPRYQI